MAEARTAGAIYDLGYQKYDGQRLGRGNAIRTLIGYSFRTTFGLGRGERAKAIPAIAFALIFIPVIIQIAIAAASGRRDMVDYTQFVQFIAPLIALFAASQAPELVVMDRHYGVLPLYLARALRPADYVLARFAAFTAALLVLTLLPELLLFAGSILVSDTPWRALVEDRGRVLPIVASTTLIAAWVAAVALALASLAAKRAYGSAAVIAFFLVLPAVAGIAQNIVSGDARRYTVLGNPLVTMVGYSNWLFEVQARRGSMLGRAALPGEYYFYVMTATLVLAIALLLVRYRRTQS